MKKMRESSVSLVWRGVWIPVLLAAGSVFASGGDAYVAPPEDLAEQLGSRPALFKFKAKLCDQERTYCVAFIKDALGEEKTAICRADAKGVCPKDPAKCGSQDPTIVFPPELFGLNAISKEKKPVSAPSGTFSPDARDVGSIEGGSR